MAYSIELDFYTDLDKTYRLAVNNANPDIMDAQVKAAMETIVSKGELIVPSAGSPTGIKAASLVRKETITILEGETP
ncbi:MAG: DUF2922 domain-containing protein [Clostridiales bacterium]|jgi:hypothetical protein|nr:DUF2922 domain-containing protein [Clostridiales bacterium]